MPLSLAQKLLLFSGGGSPVISVTGNTDFGAAPVGTPISEIFTIENTGTADLIISAISVPTGFTLTDPVGFPMTIAPNATDTFTVEMTAASDATSSGDISISSNAVGSPTLVSIIGEAFDDLIAWWQSDFDTYQSTGGAAASANNDPVGSWLDKIASYNLAVSGSFATKPELILNFQNGLPVIRSDGVSDVLRAGFTRALPQTVYTVSAVISVVNNSRMISGFSDPNRAESYMSTPDTLNINSGSNLAYLTAGLTSFKKWAYVFNNASSVIYENTTLRSSGATGTNIQNGLTLFGSPYWLLFGTNQTQCSSMNQGDLMVFDTAHDATKIARVMGYLSRRWD